MENIQTGENASLWNGIEKSFRELHADNADVIDQMDRFFPQFLNKKLNGKEFLITVENEMQVGWFENCYGTNGHTPIERAFAACGVAPDVHVRFAVDAGTVNAPVPKPSMPIVPRRTRSATPIISSTMPLNPEYTFENFVRGPSNSFAHASATAVANSDPNRRSMAYNPLFIWGGTGLGKTHLMQAIGHCVMQRTPGISVCYLTSEKFLNEYISAMSTGSIAAFRQKYRKVDVLLVDDVQFLTKTDQFQDEFFNNFNDLMLYNKQIVMTSDVAPRDLSGLEDRLKSRFSGGMVVEIESPSYETRLAILKSKAQNRSHVLPEEVLQYVAENMRSHVRAMEGALNRIITYVDMNPGVPLTVEPVRMLLRDLITQEETIKKLTVSEIIQASANFYGVSVEDVKSRERTLTRVIPRQVAMFLSCKLAARSLQDVAREFGKTHATVYYGAQNIQRRMDVDRKLKQEVEEIAIKLGRNPSDLT